MEQKILSREETNKAAKNKAKKDALAAYAASHSASEILAARMIEYEYKALNDKNEEIMERGEVRAIASKALTAEQRKGVSGLAATIKSKIAAVEAELQQNGAKPNRNDCKEYMERIAHIYGLADYRCDNKHVAALVAFATAEAQNGNVSDIKIGNVLKAVESVLSNWMLKHEVEIYLSSDVKFSLEEYKKENKGKGKSKSSASKKEEAENSAA